MSKMEKYMPVVALRGIHVMPGMLMHFDVSRKFTVSAVEQAMMGDQLLFVVAQKDEEQDDPDWTDLYDKGTVVMIKQMIRMPKDVVRVMVVGVDRGQLLEAEKKNLYFLGKVCTYDDMDSLLSGQEKNAMIENLKDNLETYMEEFGNIGEKAFQKIMNINNLSKLIDEIVKVVQLSFYQKQEILGEFDLVKRYELLAGFLLDDIELGHFRQEFQNKVKQRVDKSQKEYMLREQMRVIQKELGEDSASEVDVFRKRLEELEATEDTKTFISKEIDRLKSQAGSGSEAAVLRNYVDTLLSLPWEKKSEDCKDFRKTEKILEAEHYGLEKVKERILESLAVRLLKEKGDSPILCLVGPPGTGKTSIARSIAKSLNKEYVRICLGGVHDEAEIRGHRKTYVGAMPGRIVNAMKQVGVKNPLMLLDEIDKVSSDHRGDTSAALLEVLDGEQNNKFVDHYIEHPMDLSEVFFVCTANSLSNISQPLLDRMEVIEVSSYTEREKYEIAKRYLLKKQLEKNGLEKKQITIDKKAMEEIISGYTREAGVRKLERTIGGICRKAAKEMLEQAREEKREGTPKEQIATDKVRIGLGELEHYLGKRKYQKEQITKKAEVGVVRGLAWTSVGGTTLEIEVNVMPGKGKLIMTGTLGDVMKESAQIALTYVRSISKQYNIPAEYFYENDIHIHVPEGATPKDGPSAGITMATAILSAVTGKKVRCDIAMTGEVTLRGRVFPIGGLKEKILAAKQAKPKIVCVPEKNRKDIEELEEEILSGLEICFVEHVTEVFDKAFV